MRIHKAKASNYNAVSTEAITNYICEYNKEITELLNNDSEYVDMNRTILKSIAAELETVIKQLKATRGIY